MEIKPISLKQANYFVEKLHRHNKPVCGHKWSISAWDNNKMVGVAIVGRPIARLLDNGSTLEVLRVCTDGTRNANSFLYSQVAKIAKLMGYKRLITYTLQTESGSSLKAIGAKISSEVLPQTWERKNRPRTEQEVYREPKYR